MIDPTALPMRYDELPELGDLGVRHAWNVWPNSLGTLNRITSELVLDALAIPRQGRRNSIAAVVKRPRNVQPSAS